MHIYIETLVGKRIPIDITSLDTIADIKTKIHDIEGTSIIDQVLIFKGKELTDQRLLNLWDSSAISEPTIYLFLRLREGR